jgi:hypothetical protein
MYKKINIFRTTVRASCIVRSTGMNNALVVQNILSFLYTNSISVCETT